jgi:hypothetical protein
MSATLTNLARATHKAYHALYNGADPAATYAALESVYAAHGLDADIAESSVDWYESGPLLLESLADALARIP